MNGVELYFYELDGEYWVDIHGGDTSERAINREELKLLRDIVHNFLLDLNMELNYEK